MKTYVIRVGFAGICLGFLYYFGFLDFKVLIRLFDRPQHVLLAALLLFCTIPLGALRWHILLRCQGFRLPFSKTLEVVLVGHFFNTFLPGAYGGDIIRAGYIYHGARRQAGGLLSSILVDRLSGLVGLAVLGFAAQFWLPSLIDFRSISVVVLIVIAITAAFFLLPFMGNATTAILQRINHPLGDRILQLSSQAMSAVRTYLTRTDVLLLALIISIFQFSLVLISMVVIAGAFSFATAGSATIVLAGVISLVANSIPVTPGGIGVGEAAFANAVTLIEPTATGAYATIFLASRALTLLLSLLGGVVFLLYRNEIIEYVEEGQTHSSLRHD